VVVDGSGLASQVEHGFWLGEQIEDRQLFLGQALDHGTLLLN